MPEDKKLVVKKVKEDKPVEKKGESIDIPIGKYLTMARGNPWMVSSVVLAVLLVLSLFIGGPSAGVSKGEVSDNVLKFLNSQVDGGVTLSSIDEKPRYYELVVEYDGDQIPVYATLDGENLIADLSVLVPLDGTINDSPDNSNSNPNDQRVDVVIPEDAYVKGNADAPITIVEFSDFECPFCSKFYSESYGQIVKNYVDKEIVKIVFMNFPLSNIHPDALPAANAAECAGEQGKFFEMHDKLFENQQNLNDVNYVLWAGDIGIDSVQFSECYNSGKYNDKINQQMTYGQQLGINGTPGFFVGNADGGYVSISGAQPYGVFEQIIEAELI